MVNVKVQPNAGKIVFVLVLKGKKFIAMAVISDAYGITIHAAMMQIAKNTQLVVQNLRMDIMFYAHMQLDGG